MPDLQSAIQFCPACGGPVAWEVPADDHAPRHVCTRCGTVHYLNPKVITGVIPEAPDGRLLLCRRDIEPRRGYWTYPAGFLEMGETSAAGAAREALEESEAVVEVGSLCALINVPGVNQLHFAYRGKLVGTHFAPTPESSELRLFAEDEIPWDEIAFPTIWHSLKRFLADRAAGVEGFHALDFVKRPGRGDFGNFAAWLPAGES